MDYFDKPTTQEIHKEIDLLQSCISRMAQNSFLIKGWTVTLFAVLLGLLPERVNPRLFGVVMLGITAMFWFLDGFFVKTERNYRALYSGVLAQRPQGSRELLYELNLEKFNSKGLEMTSIWKAVFSKTLIPFYAVPAIVSVIFIVKSF